MRRDADSGGSMSPGLRRDAHERLHLPAPTWYTMDAMIHVRRAEPNEVIDLRHQVLRAGLPRETAIFPGDSAPGTVHVVALDNDDVVGCATIIPSVWEGQRAWQLQIGRAHV